MVLLAGFSWGLWGQDCSIHANDDNSSNAILLYTTPPVTGIEIPFSTLLENDEYSSTILDMKVTPVSHCGTGSDNLSIATSSNAFKITGTTQGVWTFCYMLSGKCPATGASVSDEATVTVMVVEAPVPQECADPNDCNLICFGDFDDFMTGTPDNYYSQIGLPAVFSNLVTLSGNTPDVNFQSDMINSNNLPNNLMQLLYIAASNNDLGINREQALIPLSQPIDPGCSVQISYRTATVQVQGAPPANAEVNILGLTEYPGILPVELSVIPPTPPTVFPIHPSIQATSMNPSTAILSLADNDAVLGTVTQGISHLDLVPVNYTWMNTTSIPVSCLLIYPGDISTNSPSTLFGMLCIDNLEVKLSCPPSFTCHYTGPVDVCQETPSTLSWELCGGEAETAVNTLITLPPGLTAVNPAQLIQTISFPETGCATVNIEVTTTLPVGSTFNVSLSNADGNNCAGDQFNCTESFSVIDCTPDPATCTCPPDVILSYSIGAPGQQTLITNTSLPANITYHACIRVAGNLIIDDGNSSAFSYSFAECNIIMMPGARIIVPTNSKLIFKEGSVTGCPDAAMWRTIDVQSFGTIEVLNTRFEDAHYAITLEKKSSCRITGARFIKNYVGIYTVPAEPTVLYDFLGIGINNCVFHCQNLTLHPAFNNEVIFAPGANSYAGVLLNNFAFGSSTFNTNYFHHLSNGILLNNTYFTVKNAQFEDIISNTLHTGPTGYGVRAQGNGQIVKVLGGVGATPATANFVRCSHGVEVTGMQTTVQYNHMAAVGNGVQLHTSGPNSLIVRDNVIDCAHRGIGVNNCDMSTKLLLKNNEIDVDINAPYGTLEKGWGILFSEQQLPHNDAIVEDNTIRIWSRNKGIALGGVNKLHLNFNHIFARDFTENLVGIELTDCSSLNVTCNDVTANPQILPLSPNKTVALDITNVGSSTFTCNPLLRTSTGTRFQAGCSGTDFRGNTMNNHDTGLKIELSTSLNDQLDKGNTFLNMPAPRVGAYRAFGNSTKFYVNGMGLPYFPENVNPNDNTFFQGNSTLPPYLCTSQPNLCILQPGAPSGPIRIKDDFDGRIATDDLEGTAAQKWMVQKQLYRSIAAQPEFLNNDNTMSNFWSTHTTGTLGALQSVETAKKALWTPDPTILSAIENGKTVLENLMGQLQTAAQLLPEAPTEQDWATYFATQQALLGTAHPVAQSIQTQYQQLQSTRLATADLALTQNSGIALDNSNIWQVNDRIINEIYLKAVAKAQGFSEQQLNDLAAIASQCPSEGGDAVYRARVMLAGINPEKEFVDPEKCGKEDGKERSAVSTGTEVVGITIQPNPASDKINISANLPEGFQGIVQVQDISGYRMAMQAISGTISPINLNTGNWHNGVYICILTDGTGKHIASRRFIIQH